MIDVTSECTMARKLVTIEIPVSSDVAARLESDEARRNIGALVTTLIEIGAQDRDALASLIRAIKDEAQQAGATDDLIDQELATYNAERRI